jgi:hypothetical protein
MRYVLTTPFAIGQFCIPAATVINGDKVDESEMTQWERLAQGHCPPIDAVALDWDASIVMWEQYAELRHRLQRNLGPAHEEMFQRLRDGSLHLPAHGDVARWKKAKAVAAAEADRHAEIAARQQAWAARVGLTNNNTARKD